ncbi:hypothetical protein CO660_19390 [Rhizobium sp. L9]|nr:hypothetical protein CO660_19390 [Rhizobium sp. L9]
MLRGMAHKAMRLIMSVVGRYRANAQERHRGTQDRKLKYLFLFAALSLTTALLSSSEDFQ